MVRGKSSQKGVAKNKSAGSGSAKNKPRSALSKNTTKKAHPKKDVAGKSANNASSERLRRRIRVNISKVKKRHIRTSIAIVGVIFLSVFTMMIVYRGHNFPINWFSIIVVSSLLALILGAIEYLYIVRIKGY